MHVCWCPSTLCAAVLILFVNHTRFGAAVIFIAARVSLAVSSSPFGSFTMRTKNDVDGDDGQQTVCV